MHGNDQIYQRVLYARHLNTQISPPFDTLTRMIKIKNSKGK